MNFSNISTSSVLNMVLAHGTMSPLYKHPEFADWRGGSPNFVVWTVVGVMLGSLFCLGWVYALLWYDYTDNDAYNEYLVKKREAEHTEWAAAPLPPPPSFSLRHPFRVRVNAA